MYHSALSPFLAAVPSSTNRSHVSQPISLRTPSDSVQLRSLSGPLLRDTDLLLLVPDREAAFERVSKPFDLLVSEAWEQSERVGRS